MRPALLALTVQLLFQASCAYPSVRPDFNRVGRIETPNCIGSGVEVAPHLLLTAAHVAPQGIRHPTLDLALVQITERTLIPARLSTTLPQEGDPLWLVGFGGGSQTRWSTEGRQSSARGLASVVGWYGDSGGAIFNARGEVVGIAIGIQRDEDMHQLITHHVLYIPLDDAQRWLRDQGVSVE